MKLPPISLAYSPCPNDTFSFFHLSNQKEYQTQLHDIETLNEHALKQTYDVSKLSFHAWLFVQEKYQLLQVGAALGQGCGPLLVRKKENTQPLSPTETVAIPGEYTTAHLLFKLRFPHHKNRCFMPFDQIIDAVANQQVDAGIIIHESRFLFKKQGLKCEVDLGEWWTQKTNLPIPLGCMVAKKSLGTQTITHIEAQIRHSIQTALTDPKSVWKYVKKHAQELDTSTLEKHIQTFVNPYSLQLGTEGKAAIKMLQTLLNQNMENAE